MRLASLESKCRVHRLLRVGRTRPRESNGLTSSRHSGALLTRVEDAAVDSSSVAGELS